jgi:hypothetical protein
LGRAQISQDRLENRRILAYIAPLFMERTRGELILFAAAAFGIWVSIWAVILVSKWLEAAALAVTLGAICGLALRDED